MSAKVGAVDRRAGEASQRTGEAATSWDRAIVLASLGVGTYMSALDGSIVNSILPIIAEAFSADAATIEWVVTTYLLVQSGLLLTFGRLGDMRGHRMIYLIGMVIFSGSSAFCGAAPGPLFLVIARAVQALGASMMIANSPAILTRVFPPEQRGKALGFQATTVYLGLASGPPLGGWLAGALGWRSVFYVNIPFGILGFILVYHFIKVRAPAGAGERFDPWGAASYVSGLIVLLLGLNQAHAWGWTSPLTLGCMAVGLVLLATFTTIELRVPSPMLDLTLFTSRAFSAPVLSAMLNYGATSSILFLMPFYLIQGRGLSPQESGFVLITQPLVMAITASYSGSLSDRIGSRIPATVGMAILSCGLFFLSREGGTAPLLVVVATLALIGLGIGLFTSPNNSAVMGAVPQTRRGVAAGVQSTARTLGNVLGIGMAGAIFSTVLATSDLTDPVAVVSGASLGWLAGSIVAAIGAVMSFTRPNTPLDL
ncbi:MAG: MFS transporter [Chloroflexi bacterium]|nr:MFS transporter [Chloroflexota bacterium]